MRQSTQTILALVGLCGSGKSIAAEYFSKRGYHKIHFGQITIDELKERGLAIHEENEHRIRKDLRKRHGMGAYATLSREKIQHFIQRGPVLIDGLYSMSEYKILKTEHPQLYTLAIYTNKALRYQRLSERATRPLTPQEAALRDEREISEFEKGGPIALADSTILNNTSLQDFHIALQAIDAIITQFRGTS